MWFSVFVGLGLFGVALTASVAVIAGIDQSDFEKSVQDKLTAILAEPDTEKRKNDAEQLSAQLQPKPQPAQAAIKSPPPSRPTGKPAVPDGHVQVDVGQSLEPSLAFETRFILTNSTSEELTDAGYTCLILNESTEPLKLNHAEKIVQNSVVYSPLEDLSKNLKRSLYCDFSAEPFANQLEAPILQIWVNYKVKGQERNDGFQFFAKRKPTDKTYVWFPAGNGHPIGSPSPLQRPVQP
jgi:hypothetical protein